MATGAPPCSEMLLCIGRGLREQTIPQTDVKGIVFSGIFAKNMLDFAKREIATRISFTPPEKIKKLQG